jgi:large subunit ribosomal protein L25
MSATLTFAATTRTSLGTTATAKLRQQGQVPTTLSRPGQPSLHIAIEAGAAAELAAKVVHLCHITVDGQTITALRGEIAVDCLKDKIQHIDLVQVDEKSEIIVSVAVTPDARNCPGVKVGGLVEQRLRTVKVKCKANAIPDSITVNLDNVQLMGKILAKEITLPAGVTLVTPGNLPVLSVVIPRGLKLAEEAAKAAEGAPADGKAAPAAKAAAPAKK